MITKKTLQIIIKELNDLGVTVDLQRYNGYYHIINSYKCTTLETGTANEVYYFLRGLLACAYKNIDID